MIVDHTSSLNVHGQTLLISFLTSSTYTSILPNRPAPVIRQTQVHGQIAHLIEVNETQNRRLEEMTALVASLQKENLELRMASINSGLSPNQQVDPSWNKNQNDQKPP